MFAVGIEGHFKMWLFVSELLQSMQGLPTCIGKQLIHSVWENEMTLFLISRVLRDLMNVMVLIVGARGVVDLVFTFVGFFECSSSYIPVRVILLRGVVFVVCSLRLLFIHFSGLFGWGDIFVWVFRIVMMFSLEVRCSWVLLAFSRMCGWLLHYCLKTLYAH